MTRINVMKPWIGQEEADAAAEAVLSGWVAQGPRVAQFEEAFAASVEAPHAVALSNCTTALHLALVVGGIGSGDDVVVPSFSFIATSNAPTYVGARPVFAEVDPLSGNVTAETVERALTPATRAVIVVDQGGQPVDLDRIRRLCDPRGILVIEDAACGAGSTYRGRPVGSGAELAAWSFHPRKLVTTGEGGMLTTSNAAWADRARKLREHAMSASAATRASVVLAPQEVYEEIGYNYRMTDIQAAVGLVQLRKLPAMIERRRALAARYDAAIERLPGLRAVADPEFGTANFQAYWVEVEPSFPTDREGVMAAFAAADISARRGVMAAHRQPAYADRAATLPVTDRLTERTLILPLYHELTEAEQDRVIEVLREISIAAAD